MIIAAIGCGSAPKKAVEPAKPPAIPPGLSSTKTGPIEIERRAENQRRQWFVSAKSSDLEMSKEGKLQGTMKGVTGQLYENDAVVSRFRASEAYADQDKNVLDLTSQVVVTAEKQGLVLKADKVSWLPSRRLIEASGNVSLDGKEYTVGPFDRLLATPDLKKVGTPDTFGTPKTPGIKTARTPQPK